MQLYSHMQYTVVVVAYTKWLMSSRLLAAAMDLFCFYTGGLLPEIYAFLRFLSQKNIILCTKNSLLSAQAL